MHIPKPIAFPAHLYKQAWNLSGPDQYKNKTFNDKVMICLLKAATILATLSAISLGASSLLSGTSRTIQCFRYFSAGSAIAAVGIVWGAHTIPCGQESRVLTIVGVTAGFVGWVALTGFQSFHHSGPLTFRVSMQCLGVMMRCIVGAISCAVAVVFIPLGILFSEAKYRIYLPLCDSYQKFQS